MRATGLCTGLWNMVWGGRGETTKMGVMPAQELEAVGHRTHPLGLWPSPVAEGHF